MPPEGPVEDIPDVVDLPPRMNPVEDPEPPAESTQTTPKSRSRKSQLSPEELEEVSRLESEGGLYNGDRDS
jgi:hypothetical protein